MKVEKLLVEMNPHVAHHDNPQHHVLLIIVLQVSMLVEWVLRGREC